MLKFWKNHEIWEVLNTKSKILIREEWEWVWKYWVFITDDWFDIHREIFSQRDNFPFLRFQIIAWDIFFDWMSVPPQLRGIGNWDLLMWIFFEIQWVLKLSIGNTNYINKPLLSKKLKDWGFNGLQLDIQAEICDFWVIPTIKFVHWNVEQILKHIDLSWEFHPPFYQVNQNAIWSGIIIPLHTRFSPPEFEKIKWKAQIWFSIFQERVTQLLQ